MKSSVTTGNAIYTVIQSKEKVVNELKTALKDIEKEFGLNHVAYELLDIRLKEAEKELEKLYEQTYTIYNESIAYQG